MKILIETRVNVDYLIKLDSDFIDTHTVNLDNIFDEGIIVLDKYSTIIQQLYYGNGVFINTIFSFLLKLKTEAKTIYYKKLHTQLLNSVKTFLKTLDYKIIVFEADPLVIEYLEIECIDYILVHNMEEALYEIKH